MQKDKRVLNFKFFNNNNINSRAFKILVIIMILGIILINVGNISLKETKYNNTNEEGSVKEVRTREYDCMQNNDLELKLEAILSQIDGAGDVRTMVTYSESKEIIHASNNTQKSDYITEKDSEGGTRESNSLEKSSEIIFCENGGGIENPVIAKSVEPKVLGVLVVADGAGNVIVRDKIIDAVSALLDVPSHRVQVLKKKK